jgi:chromate reductase, NAD(P)H dehydrogenase (quinone)
MSAERLRILGIPGSLRRLSFNRGLLFAARELAPDGMRMEITDLSSLPLYNADVEAEGTPLSVREFKTQIEEADALLIATPEYNHLMSGVLKNAIDWASRPPGKNPLQRKPAAIMGASGGTSGTARAQLSLRQVLTATECYVMPSPQLLVVNARERFDSDGRLTDQQTREHLRALLDAFREWVEHFHPR